MILGFPQFFYEVFKNIIIAPQQPAQGYMRLMVFAGIPPTMVFASTVVLEVATGIDEDIFAYLDVLSKIRIEGRKHSQCTRHLIAEQT